MLERQPQSDLILRRRFVTAGCMLSIFMAAVEVTIVSTAMPTIVSELGGFQLFSWVFAVYLLAQGVSTPLYGRLADLYGRKPVFVVGVIVFLVGSVACGFARQMFWLVLFRAFQGLGAGSIQSLATTIVGDIYAADQRAKVQGWLSGVWGVAAIAGPALGAFIVQHLHWAYVFWINLPIGITAIGIMILCLDETVPTKHHRIDVLGAGLLTLGASAILVAAVQAGTLGAPISAMLLTIGLIALVLLFIQERRATEPIVPFQLWRNKIMAIGNIGSLVVGALLMCVVAFLPTYMQGVMGRSATVAGAVIGAQSLSWSIGSIMSGRVIPATSYRTTGVMGGIALIAGASCLILLDRGSGLAHLVAVALLIGLGMGFCNQTFLIAVQANVGWSERGIATASILFARTIGQVLGASMGGTILNFRVAHLASGSDQALNRLLDPASRGSVDAETALALANAIGTSLHNVFVIAALLAILTLVTTLLMPARFIGTQGSAPGKST